MICKEKFQEYKGKVTIYNQTTGENYTVNNLVCDGFYSLLADRMINNTAVTISHFAVGSSTTSVDVTDTVMGTETFRKEITHLSSPGSSITLQTEIYGNEALTTWKEIGLFNDASAGTLTNHTNVDFTHSAGDVLTITWNIEKA